MNAKILTVVVGLLMLVPAGFAASYQFGDCPNGYSCEQQPSGEPFPPDAVTGHTVYAKWIMNIENNDRNTLGLPTDFAAVAGFFAIRNKDLIEKAVQRECVVWFNGKNLDQRPDPDPNFNGGAGDSNDFPSDEDQPNPDDQSYQDYDFDRDVEACAPDITYGPGGNFTYSNFAIVVEAGDCHPADGRNFEFRGHLDFVDPNGIYHEVQEYQYECGSSGPAGLGFPNVLGFGGNQLVGAIRDLFPESTHDPHNFDGCQDYHNPTAANDSTVEPGNTNETNNPVVDPSNWTAPSADPSVNQSEAYFDWGHKCNGSVRDLFTERLWMTPIHEPVFDETIQTEYNFALQIDTCSGVNVYEGYEGMGLVGRGPGKSANGTQNNYSNAHNDPGNSRSNSDPYGWTGQVNGHDVDAVDYFLDNSLIGGLPLTDVCHDGSSYSFDDTPRGRVAHEAQPTGIDQIMRGNSYDGNASSSTFGKHRQNCRSDHVDWPYNDYPGNNKAPRGPMGIFASLPTYEPQARQNQSDECYPEDHKSASIDIYVFDEDPTGLWALYTNGLTGGNTYVEGIVTGPDWLPPQQP